MVRVWHIVAADVRRRSGFRRLASSVAARCASRGGASVDRMNSANSATSTPSSSGTFGAPAGTVSYSATDVAVERGLVAAASGW